MTRIRLPYIHAFRDRHGKVRHYFRRSGRGRVPLPGLPGSADFMAAYQAALTGVTVPQKQIGAARTVAGTVQALVALDCSSGRRSRRLPPRHSARGETSSKICARPMVRSEYIAPINTVGACRC
jgi:hypothetical protein